MGPSNNFAQIYPQKIFNGSLNKYDCGLKGLDGAEIVLQHLRFQRPVRLVLSHNELGDEGCVALFDYLCSNEGRYRHNIEEISLNANDIGDRGLLAIAKYLDGNKTLGSLYLQNNNFKGDYFVILRFTVALNRSNLHTLSLTSNARLAEALTDTFLPNLSSLSLTELHLSVCGLGPKAIPPLLSYLSSPRSARLFTLKLNGNYFGLEGIETILNSLRCHNWSLIWLEMQACGVNDIGSLVWKDLERTLRDNILTRNKYLANKVAWEALGLLYYARPALLLPRGHRDGSVEDTAGKSTSSYNSATTTAKERDSVKEGGSPAVVSPHRRFPLELDMHILSYLAPSLSPTQFTRVCAFAEDRTTLPSLGLSLPSSSSFSKVSALSIPSDDLRSRGGLNPYIDVSGKPPILSRSNVSEDYLDMTARKSEQRKVWLKMVGCDRYENLAVPPSTCPLVDIDLNQSSDFRSTIDNLSLHVL